MGEANVSYRVTPEHPLTEGPISFGRAAEVAGEWAAQGDIGGIVTFEGIVRADTTEAGSVTAIEFTAHEEIATGEIGRVVAEVVDAARGGEGIRGIHLEVAIGRVAVGEIPLLILVGAVHRREAFAVCETLLERLKSEVPLFGKELTAEDGYRWKENH
ncbi:MAG: molybdenum cofactor biosynthesis protein MoaE [Spirochaeta sp.]|nr:molybdenum cofactor biosynthesis protein MoaE [Spirochaeta sp.]